MSVDYAWEERLYPTAAERGEACMDCKRPIEYREWVENFTYCRECASKEQSDE